MFHRLSITNFGAIRDLQVLDFSISNKVEVEEDRQIIGFQQSRVPKIAAILGANASGKTTAIRALGFLADFTARSALYPPDAGLFFYPFSDKESQETKSRLSVEFEADWFSPGQPMPLRYTLVAAPGKNSFQRVVESELLEYKPASQWTALVIREQDRASFRREMGTLGGKIPRTALARNNASVISLLGQFVAGNALVDAIQNSLSGVVSNFYFWGRPRITDEETAKMYADDPDTLKALNNLIKRADLGINDVRVQEFPGPGSGESKRMILYFRHSGLNSDLPAALESQGTMNFVSVFPLIHRALVSGGIALMDELDSDLHPELLREILGWFTDPETNPHNAQLITTCNNPAVLDFLRKEEIFFSKKDDGGRVKLYGLKDIPGVRRDANFQRDYLAGRYGAIPYIG